MEKEIIVASVAQYVGHDISANTSVNLKLKFDYSEMVNYIRLLQFLNNDVTIFVKDEGKNVRLGMFRIKGTAIDGDGVGKITFNSATKYVEADRLNDLVPLSKGENMLLVVTFSAMVEVEEEENPEEEQEDDWGEDEWGEE